MVYVSENVITILLSPIQLITSVVLVLIYAIYMRSIFGDLLNCITCTIFLTQPITENSFAQDENLKVSFLIREKRASLNLQILSCDTRKKWNNPRGQAKIFHVNSERSSP